MRLGRMVIKRAWGICLLLGSFVVGLGAVTDLELPIEDKAMIQKALGLDLEQQRYLTYLYARIHKPNVAESIGRQVLAENPSDRQTLLVLASLAVEQRNGSRVIELAETFLSYYPNDHQGLYFLGAGYYMLGRFSESEQVLADMKRDQFRGQLYPYETDLASASASAGQWYRAMLGYQRLLRHHDLGEQLRAEVRRVLDGIYREHGPRVDLAHDGVVFDNGAVGRSSADHAMHLTERLWWTVAARQDRVEIERAPGLLARKSERGEFATNLHRVWDARTSGMLGVGHGGQGTTAEASVSHEFAPARSVTLGAGLNQRSTDSLLVESLDGRQDKVELIASWLVEADLAVNMRISSRILKIGGQEIGRGTGAELAIEHTLRRRGAQWVVGYRGSVANFSAARFKPGLIDAILDPRTPLRDRRLIQRGLVAPEINRHGMSLLIADDLTHVWSYRLALGADYDFVLESLGFNAGLQWVFRPRKSIEIGAEAGYSSSADNSNAGRSALLLDLSFRLYY